MVVYPKKAYKNCSKDLNVSEGTICKVLVLNKYVYGDKKRTKF